VKITQIFPHTLICKDDQFWESFFRFFIIVSIGAVCFAYGTYPLNPSFKIGLYAILIGIFVCIWNWQCITIFDLSRKSVQFKKHWLLFRGNYCKEYPISLIKNIELYHTTGEYCYPSVRLKNGKLLRMTNTPMTKRSASQDVEIIREFLGFNIHNH
jgi:hypothetical protein